MALYHQEMTVPRGTGRNNRYDPVDVGRLVDLLQQATDSRPSAVGDHGVETQRQTGACPRRDRSRPLPFHPHVKCRQSDENEENATQDRPQEWICRVDVTPRPDERQQRQERPQQNGLDRDLVCTPAAFERERGTEQANARSVIDGCPVASII